MMNYIYGKNTVTAYLKEQGKAFHLFIQKGIQVDEILELANKQQISYSFENKKALDKKVEGNHQGIVLEVAEFQYSSLESIIDNAKNKIIFVGDQLEDPHNLGAIIRTCDAVGVDGVIIPERRSVGVTPTVAKVSTGAIYTVKIHQATNIVDTLNKLKKEGYWVVGAENGINAVDYTEFPVDMPLVVVVGSEGKGISRLVKENCDILTTIPMEGFVNSLNVSVASAVLLYEIKRRKSMEG
ncbi:MAG TPA: 23S rRNA (guanosine(2251)-2'-O)-methyltransferase RlmB [Erysipelothrix sp.]